MPKLCSVVLLLTALLIQLTWAQGLQLPAPHLPNADSEEGAVPNAFFTRSLITGRIECDSPRYCSATDGVTNNIFWTIDMRAIPHEQVAYISQHCGYDASRGCSARYLIYPDFPFLKVVQVVLGTDSKLGE